MGRELYLAARWEGLMDIKGLRTFIFSIVALAFLTSGLAMSLGHPVAGIALFSSFATSIVGIVFAVAGKSTIGSLGEGTGVKGAWAALTTDVKPGSPTTPPAASPPKTP
jgi:hypothetical protein